MKTSPTIVAISTDLLSAQKEIGSATKDAVNPFFKSKYADLGSVMEACKDALNKFGISVLQPIGSSEQGTTVETILLHESGEWISDTMTVEMKQSNDPQAQGSAITYARRYSLQSMLFIPADDDDGEKGTDHKKISPTTAPDELGVCNKCGAPNKWSEAKQKAYCSKLCWRDSNPDNLAIKPRETTPKQEVITGSPEDESEKFIKGVEEDQKEIFPEDKDDTEVDLDSVAF